MTALTTHRKQRSGRQRWAGALALLAGAVMAATVQVPGAALANPTDAHHRKAPGPAAKAAGYRLDPELVVQWHGMWSYYTDDQREHVLQVLQDANIHTVQMDVSWAMIQPHDRDSVDPWGVGYVDHVIDMVNAHGMTAIVTLWLTPGWANGHVGERALPTDPADYARVANWAANRYAGKVSAWEVWTEPNKDDALAGAANPFDYVRMLRLAYPAIKAGDPAATVVFGGLQYNDDTWLASAYAAGAKGYFDVMATHAYQGAANESPLAPDDGAIWRFSHLPAVRALMVANGDGDKSIWTTTGYSSHVDPPNTPPWYNGVSEVTQATYLGQAVNQVRDNWPWVGKFVWSMARDEDVSANYFHERHYGLLRADLSAKPALATLAALTMP